MSETGGDIVVIAGNPYSGAKRNRELVDALGVTLERRGLRPLPIWDKAELAERAQNPAFVQECRCVIAAGGDGTLLHVVNAERNLPIVHYPLGNENLFAGHFGVSTDPDALVSMIEAGRTRRVDLGVVNDLRFTCVVSAGFDAEVVRRVDKWRTVQKTWRRVNRISYLRPIASTALSYRYPRMTVTTAEGKTIAGSSVFVFNLPRYGMGLPICPVACDDDGLIDYVVFERPGRLRLAALAWSVKRGRHLDRPDVKHGRTRGLRIESEADDVPVEIDGDPGGVLPVTLGVEPGALRVIVRPDQVNDAGA